MTPASDATPPGLPEGGSHGKPKAAPRSKPKGRPRSGRLLLVLATLLGLSLGVGALAAWWLLPSLLEERVLEEARRRGVLLVLGRLELGLWRVTLRDTEFSLVGVPGLSGRLGRADIEMRGWSPERLDAREVAVRVEGSAPPLAVALGAWTARHPNAYALAVTASGLTLEWRAAATAEPWLTLAGGTLSHGAQGVRFQADAARMQELALGKVAAAWSNTGASVSLAFDAADLEHARLRMEVRHASAPPEATIVLEPTPVERLAGPLALPLAAQGVRVGGRVQLVLPAHLEPGPVEGQVELTLFGYVPPHPVELDGFVFGDQTRVETHLRLAPDLLRADLTDTRVSAGAFRLSGGGEILRDAEAATLALRLAGHLPCAELAASAARARLGSVLGALSAHLARQVVGGSVAVHVSISADSRALSKARVERRIGVGCGLGPLSARDLARLPQLAARIHSLLDEGAAAAEKLPATLAALPDSLPAPPPLPSATSIDLELPKLAPSALLPTLDPPPTEP